MLMLVLTILTVLCATLHIRAEYRGPQVQVYICKPLTVVSILSIALLSRHSSPFIYRLAIWAGLVFSLIGDILLMLPSDRFVAGLSSFLVAHLCYITAFVSGQGFGLSPWILIPLGAAAASVYGILWPRLGKLRLPVLIYVFAIVTMAWQAGERFAKTAERKALLPLVGALLFIVSDAVLMLTRLRGQRKKAQALVLGTYYAAQWFIAQST
jgi:uncharacterized membrane protein YhhN